MELKLHCTYTENDKHPNRSWRSIHLSVSLSLRLGMYQAKALPHLLQQLHRLPPPSCCWARCPRLRPGQVTQKLALNSGKGAHAVSAELKAMRPTALSVHSACVAPCRNTSLLLLLVTDANACCDVNMYPNKGLDSQFDNTHRRHCRSKTLFGTTPRPP